MHALFQTVTVLHKRWNLDLCVAFYVLVTAVFVITTIKKLGANQKFVLCYSILGLCKTFWYTGSAFTSYFIIIKNIHLVPLGVL